MKQKEVIVFIFQDNEVLNAYQWELVSVFGSSIVKLEVSVNNSGSTNTIINRR